MSKPLISSGSDDSDEEYVIIPKLKIKPSVENKILRKKVAPTSLKLFNTDDESMFEIGVDEAGRGPLFGRVYAASVTLPKDGSFDCSKVKDSKKFHSKRKIEEAAAYIKENALAWHVSYEDEKTIDQINILQATQLAMRNSILEVRKKLNEKMEAQCSSILLIDGNYFNPITYLDKATNKLAVVPFITVEGGDNLYASIAAASILAKVERDKYIDDMCAEHAELSEYYGIDSNKGYGAKKHIDGIKEHGITIWHRRTFGICKNYS